MRNLLLAVVVLVGLSSAGLAQTCENGVCQVPQGAVVYTSAPSEVVVASPVVSPVVVSAAPAAIYSSPVYRAPVRRLVAGTAIVGARTVRAGLRVGVRVATAPVRVVRFFRQHKPVRRALCRVLCRRR